MNIPRPRPAWRSWALPTLAMSAVAVAASVITAVALHDDKAAPERTQRLPVTLAAKPGITPTALNGTGNEVWGANYFPNVVLTDQDGKRYRFFDDLLKDKVVSINFIFTACAQACGLETARIKEIHQILGDRVGKDVFIYSISIDPLNDTPEELKKYAGKFGADLPGWRFLTGKPADIDLIRRKFGMDNEDGLDPNDLNAHRLHAVIGNQATGRWMRASPFENPQFTATQIGSWLHNYKHAESKETRYENAPLRLRSMSDGEKLFRHRCAACHTIDGAKQSARRQIGPDLDGVTKRRDGQWLARWMKEPDRMLAEKDPVAMALFEQYNRIPMPNLRLDAKDIRAVLEFIAEESSLPLDQRRVALQ